MKSEPVCLCGWFEMKLYTGCSGWIHEQCSLARAVDMLVCKLCEREENGKDRDVDESMDLGNGVHLENAESFVIWGI